MKFNGYYQASKWIAALYKFVGLFSIPLLTIVTIISISNVFTRGQLASASWVQMTWAIIFAACIDVNIVRLFFEAKLDQDRGAFVVGIGLAFVAGSALLIEGLQQSIGFAWSNQYIQFVIGFVIALRVLLVVVLMAREGAKLGKLLLVPEPQNTAEIVNNSSEILPETSAVDLDTDPALQATRPQKYLITFEEASTVTGYATSTLRQQLKAGEIEANSKGDKLKISTLKIKPGYSTQPPALSIVREQENEREIS